MQVFERLKTKMSTCYLLPKLYNIMYEFYKKAEKIRLRVNDNILE